MTSQGHSCSLCGPWERAGRGGAPRTSGSLASHLCLSVLSSSACFVDTWPRLSRHLLLFLLGWQAAFPSPPIVTAGAAPRVQQPTPRLGTQQQGRHLGGPRIGSAGSRGDSRPDHHWQLSFASHTLCLSFLICQTGMITGPTSQGEARWYNEPLALVLAHKWSSLFPPAQVPSEPAGPWSTDGEKSSIGQCGLPRSTELWAS